MSPVADCVHFVLFVQIIIHCLSMLTTKQWTQIYSCFPLIPRSASDIPLPNGCAMTNKPTPFLCLCVTAFIIPFTVSFVPPEVTSSVASLSSSTSRFANQSGDEIPTVYPLSRRKVMLIEEAKKLDPAIASGNKVGKTLIFSGSAVVCPSSIVLCNI
jgi:hypothetical protein